MHLRFVTILASSLLLSSAALATGPGNNGGGNGGCGVGQQTNGCGHSTPAPVNNYSPNLTGEQYQKQGQIQGQAQGQGQAQSSRNSNRNTNANQNVNSVNSRNTNRVGATAFGGTGYGGTGIGGQGGQANNAGNVQTTSYNYQEARQRLRTPDLYGNFAGSATSPCERNTFGLGATMPGYGGLLQIPVKSSECWNERSADRLIAMGCTNAGLAVLAGDPVRVALANNPCGGQRAIRAKH